MVTVSFMGIDYVEGEREDTVGTEVSTVRTVDGLHRSRGNSRCRRASEPS